MRQVSSDMADERPQPSRARRSSSSSATQSIERLTEIMADFIKSTDNRSKGLMTKGEVVPSFDPDDKEHHSLSWCNKVDELREVFGWSEEATIYFALSKLRGLAEVWYKGLPTVKFTWEQWKEKIQTAFPSRKDYYEMLGDMMRRRKQPAESYAKYFYEKSALLTQCKIFGYDAVSCIVGGIDDIVVKTGAKAGNYQTPETLFQYLNSLDNIVRTTRRPNNNFNSHPKVNRSNRFTSKERHMTPKRCFKCGKNGHISSSCFQSKHTELRCTTCRSYGHLDKDCRNKQSAPSSSTIA